jgi:hypothetical protein
MGCQPKVGVQKLAKWVLGCSMVNQRDRERARSEVIRAFWCCARSCSGQAS